MDEIVAAKIGTTITNRPADIVRALESGRQDIEFLSRQRMQLMSSFDLGIRWDTLATSPTLFMIDDNGNPVKVEEE